MKIVHLVGWYFPESVGGTEIYVEALSRRLVDAGYEVRVAAPLVSTGTTETYQHDGVPVFRYGVPARPSRDEACHCVDVRGAEHLHAWLAAERAEVLHVHSFTTGVGLPEIRIAAKLGMRVIVTCHLPGFGYMCRTGELMQWGRTACDGLVATAKCASCSLTRLGLPLPLSALMAAVPVRASRGLKAIPGRLGTTLGMTASVEEYRRMQGELFDVAERIVVLNDTARRMLIANGHPAEKLVVSRLGVSQVAPRRYCSAPIAPSERVTRFGYLGRLHPAKGLTTLVRAVAALPRDVDFALEIRGPALDAFSRRYVNDLQMHAAGDPRISFEAGVPVSEVPEVLAALDLLIIPSISFENGPTVALESMAAGTPVIASRVGNLAEIVQDGVNGRLVTAGDVPALAAALRDAATRPVETIESWRRNLAAPRTMDDVAQDYLALYAA